MSVEDTFANYYYRSIPSSSTTRNQLMERRGDDDLEHSADKVA